MSSIQKAEWSTAFINGLPDSSFAYIEPGGTKDEDGKTTPRSLRHFPIKDADGKPDAAHVRNALARLDQSDFGDKARPKVETAAKELGIDSENEPKKQKQLDVKFDFPITIQKQYIQKSSDDGEEDKWYIEGYAATSDFDLQGDIISKEALQLSETQLLDNSTVLYNHKDSEPIGRVVESKLDENGLLLKILISQTVPDIWKKIQEGVLNKFSISAKVIKAAKKFVKDIGTIANVIDEMLLLEVSLVSVPANPQAKAIGWYVGKALREYEKKGGEIEMSKGITTVHKSDEAQLDEAVDRKKEPDTVTDEEGNVVEAPKEDADVKVATPEEADAKKSAPAVTTTDNSLDSSGNGSAPGGTQPNATANDGVKPSAGFTIHNEGVTPAAGKGNSDEPDAPAAGFKKGLGWVLSDLEYVDEYLESPDCTGVPGEVRDAIKAAIRALSPAAGAIDEAEDAMEAAALGKDAAKVETVDKAATTETEPTEAEKEIAALKKSNETLTAAVATLQKSMPVTRKGFIRNDGPDLDEHDSKREAIKNAGDPEARLRKGIELGIV